MPDRQAGGTAGEAAVGDQRAHFAEPLRFDVAGGIKHLLHAWAAARSLVANHDDVASLDLAAENALDRGVLTFEDPRRTLECQDALVDTRGLHDAAVQRQISRQHRKAAVPGIGMLAIADTAGGAVGVEFLEPALLAERHLGRHIAGRRHEELADALAPGLLDVPAAQRILQRRAVDHRQPAIEQAGAVELAEDGHDAAGAVNVLEVHVGHRGRHLAQHRHPARQPVDILHGEGDAALIGGRQQMQHCVGGTTHRDIERHGVLERLEVRNRPRQRGFVVLLVVAARQIDNQMAGLDEQPLAIGVGRQHRPVARQRQP